MSAVRSYLQVFMAIDEHPRVLEPGQVLFKEGDMGSEMFVVRTGTVILQVGGRSLETVPPFGIVGEMALIDPAPRSATAIAGPGCSVTAVNEYTFLDLVRKVPGLAIEMMKILAQRIRRSNEARRATEKAAPAKRARPAARSRKAPARARPKPAAGRKKRTAKSKTRKR